MAKSSFETPAQGSEVRTCLKHGEYTSTPIYGTIRSKCPDCSREHQEREAAMVKRADDAREREMMDARLRRSGLVGRFQTAAFGSFTAKTAAQRKALDASIALGNVEAFRGAGNLILIGPPGTGKTHLASALVNQVIRERKAWAAIHSAREVVRMLRATWGKRESAHWDDVPQTETDLINHLSSIALLCIDEAGLGFGSEAETVQLFDIIDGRYQRELPIVLCSNLALPELRQVLGERVFDRVREGATVVPCTWASHRGNPSP